MVGEAIDQLPWFGLHPFEPTIAKNPRQDPHFRIYYDRRVLISWLVGRPVSEIAKRAGCSVRFVYKVLERIFYRSLIEFDIYSDLTDLGLFKVIDAPEISQDWPDIEFEGEVFGSVIVPDEIYETDWYGTAIGVCLVCHRVAVLMANDDPEHDLEEIPPDVYIHWLHYEQATAILGHLACHFFLEIPWSEAGLVGPKSRFPSKVGSLALGLEAVNVFLDWFSRGAHPLTPVVNGIPMDIEKARRWWLGMLSGRKSSLPKR